MKPVNSGRWRLGLFLSLTTAILWGAVPLAMVPLVHSVDPVTISWFHPDTPLTPVVLLASLVVVVGSIACALGGERSAARPAQPVNSA